MLICGPLGVFDLTTGAPRIGRRAVVIRGSFREAGSPATSAPFTVGVPIPVR